VSSITSYGAPLSRRGDSLADVLERVLDKGVVIAGDIVVNVLDIELLTLKLRLLVASADTARAMGIDWWESDPFLNSRARAEQKEIDGSDVGALRSQNAELQRRIDQLERIVRQLPAQAGGA
jgi:hypothetical protein